MPYSTTGAHHYFTEFTFAKAVIYTSIVTYVVLTCLVVVLELVYIHPCDTLSPYVSNSNRTFENPAYVDIPCRRQRQLYLLFMTPDECSYGRRLLLSVILGGIIGWERRDADRPAGIRTMSLVSLGSCLFSVNSAYAFLDGPMNWDASRISAAIPSGVGFLGAGLIFKQAQQDRLTGETNHVVHGLTTASSLWISAAVGMACAGELYFAAYFTVALVMALLRFGPRQIEHMDEDLDEGLDDKHAQDTLDFFATDRHPQEVPEESTPLTVRKGDASVDSFSMRSRGDAGSNMFQSTRRKRATLGGIV